jgi:hypothetical protein
MRFLAAGLLSLAFASAALAQAAGEVEGIGFNTEYRPGCWVPMVVRLTPETTKTDTFQIQVVQRDLDCDRVVYTRTITLTGNAEGQPPRVQRFWMYFVPQPTNGSPSGDNGLPDPSEGLAAIKRELRVYLATASGKQLVKLPVTSTVVSTDVASSGGNFRRGRKLILTVSEGLSQPSWHDFDGALGLLEDVDFVAARPTDLPENTLGYESVDAVLWLAADPASLNAGTGEKMRALQDWVRQGGRLVVCQMPEWRKTQAFNDLLPVMLLDVVDKPDVEPLRSLAVKDPVERRSPDNPWNRLGGPFKIARAQANPGAVVDEWIDWKADANPPDRTPYIARAAYGAGATTWVAQDLGDPNITIRTKGWANVWDRVFDWKNDPVVNPKPDEMSNSPFAGGSSADLGASLLSQTENSSKGTALIFLAIVFFIFYWIVAGPGTYLFLAGKKRAGLSWFMFAVSALVATALTMLVVQVVLRGKPSIKHITLVRMVPDQPAMVHSRIGLYIPRDGEQQIQLKDTAPNAVSYLSPFKIHPFYLRQADTGFSDPIEYKVPVRDALMTEPPTLRVPYRSTLKKFEIKWVGNLKGGISGTIRLLPSGMLDGAVTNNTGHDLRDAYFAFRSNFEWVLYVRNWPNGTPINLTSFKDRLWMDDEEARSKLAGYYGRIALDPRKKMNWDDLWYSRVPSAIGAESSFQDLQYTFPMLSLFDRLPVMLNDREDVYRQRFKSNRKDLLRRGARFLDLSQVVSGGQLVVLAMADGPLPIPVEVEGERIDGEGTLLYQIVLPLDRQAFENPTTQPSATPGTHPAQPPGQQPAQPTGPTIQGPDPNLVPLKED